jgi:GTP-binding protein HflX
MYHVSLIGYTNSGKSTLLHALTGADVLIADQLFATLDTTTRRLRLNNQLTVLLSDTVGFINKLPHHLIASFQSTLAQVKEADILLHIVDLNNNNYPDHISIVKSSLKEMGIDKKQTIIIFNKVDMIQDEEIFKYASEDYPGAIFISATKKIRIQNLIKKIIKLIENKIS